MPSKPLHKTIQIRTGYDYLGWYWDRSNQRAMLRRQYYQEEKIQLKHKHLEYWIDLDGKGVLITEISDHVLKKAIEWLEKGYACWGQQAKIITLKKEKERRDANKPE